MSFRSETWTEKYRPRSLDEVVGNNEVLSMLKRFVEEKNMPHMLFYGPPGVGKTSAIQALACDVYGRDYEELQRLRLVLESNASTLNRIIDIRDTEGRPGPVKRFIRSAVPLGEPFKVLILDEAERLTVTAQHAMRRLMEVHYRTCRVCIICNQPGQIIDYLRSRCSVFNFRPLQGEEVKERLKVVAKSENLGVDESALDMILKLSSGDLRKAINILQTAATKACGTIDVESVYDTRGGTPSDRIREILNLSLRGDFIQAEGLLRELFEEKVPATEILTQLSSEIPQLSLETKSKTKLMDTVARTDYIITQSSNIDLQLSSLIAKITLIGKETGDVN